MTATPPTPENCRRLFYRLRYPISCRPSLWIHGQAYAVTELSEQGLRFAIQGHPESEFATDERIQGILELDAKRETVEGVIRRHDEGEVVVVGVSGITFRQVIAEQRRLASRVLGYRET